MDAHLQRLAAAGAALALGCAGPVVAQEESSARPLAIAAAWATEPVSDDADDPAVWIHPEDPAKSVILGTDKVEKTGGLFAFALGGKTVQHFGSVDRPNNVDVEYGFELGGKKVDLAVATERGQRRLRVFAIDRTDGRLADMTGKTAVFEQREGEARAPMGVGLWKTPAGEIHAFVAPKTGPKQGYLHQYRLVANEGKVDAVFVRELGEFSGSGEIEAVLVDDEEGKVFYSDEEAGIRWAWCDPAKAGGGIFGTSGYLGDREGLALWKGGPGGGCLVSSDQVKGGSRVLLYPRGGGEAIATIPTPADETDGLEVAEAAFPGMPEGALVMMNSKDKNFLVFDLRELRKRAAPTR